MSCNCNKVGVSNDHVNTNLYMEDNPWLSGISYNISSNINKKEVKEYYAKDKVVYKNKKATVVSRNYHPDGKKTYSIKLNNNKIIEYADENIVYKIT